MNSSIVLKSSITNWAQSAIFARGLFKAVAVVAGLGASQAFAAPPSVAQVLEFRPRQPDVQITTPKPEEIGSCRVELVKGAGKTSGWVLLDSAGNTLRRFFDSNGDNKTDTWGYYKDGVEVYREIDTNSNTKPDQYRWLNTGGLRWGVDLDEDGRIDSWIAISPEELSQEILKAIITKDPLRVQALMVNETDIKTLGIPDAAARPIREKLAQVLKRFQATLAKAEAINDKTTWLHLELGLPQCLPADQLGLQSDLVRHPKGAMLLEIGGKTEWIQTGELLQIGAAWKLVEGPTVGMPTDDDMGSRVANNRIDLEKDPVLKKLIDELSALDQAASSTQTTPQTMEQYHLKRADILEKIGGVVKAQEREPWYRQLADSLSSAAQVMPKPDSPALKRLKNLEGQLVQATPGANLTAYVTYRLLQSEYSNRLGQQTGDDLTKVHEEFAGQFNRFVQTYSKSDEVPDAYSQLGLISEFLGKDQDAKNAYTQVVKWYSDKPNPASPQALKASGAIRRLESEGKALSLQGPLLTNPSQTFDIEALKGKVVVVYFGGSWNQRNLDELAKLKLLMETYGSKGAELVTVSLDAKQEDALTIMTNGKIPGTHLFSPMSPNGQEGKLSTDFGIVVVPHLFLVGKDGKVINRNARTSSLEEELKKALK